MHNLHTYIRNKHTTLVIGRECIAFSTEFMICVRSVAQFGRRCGWGRRRPRCVGVGDDVAWHSTDTWCGHILQEHGTGTVTKEGGISRANCTGT